MSATGSALEAELPHTRAMGSRLLEQAASPTGTNAVSTQAATTGPSRDRNTERFPSKLGKCSLFGTLRRAALPAVGYRYRPKRDQFWLRASLGRHMADNVEQRTAEAGYALVELHSTPLAERAAADEKLETLRRRMDALQADIGRAHNELSEIERAARTAVEAEDAERVAASWNDKRRVLSRISDIEREQTDARRQLESEIRSEMVDLKQARAEILRQHAEQDAAWRQLTASAEALVEGLKAADKHRAVLHERERAWRERLETLAGRELALGFEGQPAAARRPGRRTAPADAEAKTASRQWSVYDPDSGTTVGSLAELRRLLARWYPNLHTEQERVREFLQLRNTEPLPDRLRQELQEAGYFTPPDAPTQ